MSYWNPAKVHLTVPKQFRVRRDIPRHLVVHNADLADEELASVEGVPTTTVRRAIEDCHRKHLGPALLRQAIEEGRRQGYLRGDEARELRELVLRRPPRHQRAQVVQVMVRKNRSAIECGRIRVEFVARHDLEQMPVTEFKTPRGMARYSTAELTALEMVGYPSHAGGLSNVATVLRELAEEMEAGLLVQTAALSPVSWSQRLGYLLELVQRADLAHALAPFVRDHARSYTPLRRAARTTGAHRNRTWKVIINVDV